MAVFYGILLGFIAFVIYRLYLSYPDMFKSSSTKLLSTYNSMVQSNPSWCSNPDKFTTYDELVKGMKEAGVESSNLVIGIDFTKSNNWNGAKSFGGQSLHHISDKPNPYEQVIEIMGKTLEPFDDDHYIPAYIFGDISTTDKYVLPIFPQNRPCFGFQEVLTRYRELAQCTTLSGPTSFAPIINETINIVKNTKSYHILLIIADGQVTNEKETEDAIVNASNYPISIVVVGVGDGPWEKMEEFDDKLPSRKFDNFQFISFNDILSKHDGNPVAFALHALMEIPDQYNDIKKLGLLEALKKL